MYYDLIANLDREPFVRGHWSNFGKCLLFQLKLLQNTNLYKKGQSVGYINYDLTPYPLHDIILIFKNKVMAISIKS